MLYELALYPHNRIFETFKTYCPYNLKLAIPLIPPLNAQRRKLNRTICWNKLIKSVYSQSTPLCRCAEAAWLPAVLHYPIRTQYSVRTVITSALDGSRWRLPEPELMSVGTQGQWGNSPFRKALGSSKNWKRPSPLLKEEPLEHCCPTTYLCLVLGLLWPLCLGHKIWHTHIASCLDDVNPHQSTAAMAPLLPLVTCAMNRKLDVPVGTNVRHKRCPVKAVWIMSRYAVF